MSFERISATTDKRAEIFSFTESERFAIMQQAEKGGFGWNIPSERGMGNHRIQLEQLMNKEASLALHTATLTEYLKVKRIPRGLRSTLTPMLLKEDRIYKQRWEALSNQHSFDLMLLTVQHLQAAVQTVRQDIQKVDAEFKNHSPVTEYNKTHEELKGNIEKLKDQIMNNKIKKFERDTRDYEMDRVYTWAAERPQYRGQRFTNKARNPHADKYDTDMVSRRQDSDSSDQRSYQYKRDFLAKGGDSSSGSERPETAYDTRSKKGKLPLKKI